jgi:hypothetical protein
MPRLGRELSGAEPVDQHGNRTGSSVTLPVGTEYTVTVRKLKRPSDNFEEYWSEIRVAGQLYRVPLRLLEIVNAA